MGFPDKVPLKITRSRIEVLNRSIFLTQGPEFDYNTLTYSRTKDQLIVQSFLRLADYRLQILTMTDSMPIPFRSTKQS